MPCVSKNSKLIPAAFSDVFLSFFEGPAVPQVGPCGEYRNCAGIARLGRFTFPLNTGGIQSMTKLSEYFHTAAASEYLGVAGQAAQEGGQAGEDEVTDRLNHFS